MGLISKRINQRKTDQLAQPVKAETLLDAYAVLTQARNVIESWKPGTGFGGVWNEENYRYYWRQKSDGSTWIVCGVPVTIQGSLRRDWQSDQIAVAHWEAKLEVAGAGEGTGRHVIQLQLARWKTKDGKMEYRKAFESFRDQFFAAIRQADGSLKLYETV